MNDFSWFNETFYRALSRRVFIELSRDNNDMGDIYPELSGKGIKIKDVASLVSGIIFIDDHSILQKDDQIYNVYIYTNPNSTNTKITKINLDILHWSRFAKQPTVIEDFINDNY